MSEDLDQVCEKCRKKLAFHRKKDFSCPNMFEDLILNFTKDKFTPADKEGEG